ncbi:MAG: EAL domain-containing protein [Terracidiphilus sp.]|jgi:EAL domain-containing protein (putative c-di-GMP-specific phosphodiesterase class I)
MFLDYHDVCRAFGEDEFFPFYQPLVELRTRQLTGFEALARWNHSLLGAISPDAFIPIVQKSGLINTLTRKLLEKTFSAAPALPALLRLSINLSPVQLADETLPSQLAAVAQRGGFSLDRLTVEMTQSALLEDLPNAQAATAELKTMNCRLALDNFGTGHSSLFHLQALPFDELKIDRSFVHAITQNRDSRKIVAALLGLAKSMDLITVAEGVETEEQASVMNDLGCDLAQGWLFGRPASAEEIPRMVSDASGICAAFSPVHEVTRSRAIAAI